MNGDRVEDCIERFLYGLYVVMVLSLLAFPIGAIWDAVHGDYTGVIVIGVIVAAALTAWIAGGLIARCLSHEDR